MTIPPLSVLWLLQQVHVARSSWLWKSVYFILQTIGNPYWAENKDVMLSSLHFQKLWLVQCGEWTSRSAWEENRARGSEEASYEVSGIV